MTRAARRERDDGYGRVADFPVPKRVVLSGRPKHEVQKASQREGTSPSHGEIRGDVAVQPRCALCARSGNSTAHGRACSKNASRLSMLKYQGVGRRPTSPTTRSRRPANIRTSARAMGVGGGGGGGTSTKVHMPSGWKIRLEVLLEPSAAGVLELGNARRHRCDLVRRGLGRLADGPSAALDEGGDMRVDHILRHVLPCAPMCSHVLHLSLAGRVQDRGHVDLAVAQTSPPWAGFPAGGTREANCWGLHPAALHAPSQRGT